MRWLAFFLAPAVFAPTTRYLDVDLKWAQGAATIVATRAGRFDKPTSLRRYRGRFTARLLHGEGVLLEYPFDVPLLADAEEPGADDATQKLGERFRRGVTAAFTLRVPLPDGTDTLAVYDTRTKKTVLRRLAE